MTVDQVVTRALDEGLEIRENQAEIQAARSTLKATRALYGPRIVIEGSALYFNAPPAEGRVCGKFPPPLHGHECSCAGQNRGQQHNPEIPAGIKRAAVVRQ